MRITLRKKYVFFGILLISAFLGLLFASAGLFQYRMMNRWNRAELEEVAAGIIRKLDASDWNMEKTEIDNIAFENNVFVTVADEEYRVIYSTRHRINERKTLGKNSMKLIENTNRELTETGHSFGSNFDDDNQASFIQVNKVNGRGYLVLHRSVTGFKSSMHVIKNSFVIAAVLTLLCCSVVLLLLTKRMVHPICEISRITGQIADLNFNEKAEVSTGDELGMLAESVNRMSDKLKEAMDELQDDLERRKVLVRNMSHELKTPAAVIMGYAENLEYIAEKQPEKLGKYCAVITKECESMDDLISRMLELSASEKGAQAMHLSEISPKELLKGVRRKYELELTGHKGAYLENDELMQSFSGDFEMLQRALYNLVKNAVRYGAKEGRIRIHLWESVDYIHFCVYNDGSHIPEEIQEKIWDEFYKTDPSRKREHGSFGIGLSIVKQTALAHGGGVAVKNTTEGVEVEFYISAKNN